jgi:hypothetical protein
VQTNGLPVREKLLRRISAALRVQRSIAALEQQRQCLRLIEQQRSSSSAQCTASQYVHPPQGNA